MAEQTVIRCTGRTVNWRTNKPRGRECGTVFQPDTEPAAATSVIESARAAGWRISPPAADGTVNAMCPPCATPTADKTKGHAR